MCFKNTCKKKIQKNKQTVISGSKWYLFFFKNCTSYTKEFYLFFCYYCFNNLHPPHTHIWFQTERSWCFEGSLLIPHPLPFCDLPLTPYRKPVITFFLIGRILSKNFLARKKHSVCLFSKNILLVCLFPTKFHHI